MTWCIAQIHLCGSFWNRNGAAETQTRTSFSPKPRIFFGMARYTSGSTSIQIDQFEPETHDEHPALVVLHGSGGAAFYWMESFAPMLKQAGVAVYAPHYFEKTGTHRPTSEMILDGRHFGEWLTAVQDALNYVSERPCVDSARIGVAGISLGGYLAVALGIEDKRVRAVVEISGGVPLGWEHRMTSASPATLIVHGESDDVVPVAEANKLRALLELHRVPHEVEIFPHQSHWFSGTTRLALLLRCTGFLEKHLFRPSSLRMAS